jgi:hypothetical protein
VKSVKVGGIRLTEAAKYLGRDLSTVSLAVKRLEEQMQSDPKLRKRLEDTGHMTPDMCTKTFLHSADCPAGPIENDRDFLLSYPWPGNVLEFQEVG